MNVSGYGMSVGEKINHIGVFLLPKRSPPKRKRCNMFCVSLMLINRLLMHTLNFYTYCTSSGNLWNMKMHSSKKVISKRHDHFLYFCHVMGFAETQIVYSIVEPRDCGVN